MRFVLGIILFLLLQTTQAQTRGQADSSKYSIVFYRIDNSVKLYIGDKVVFESELIDGDPELDLKVDITPFLKKGVNVLKIELFNGSSFNQVMSDTHWAIRYEIFEDNESIDYTYQETNDGKDGLVFSMKHEIYSK